MDKAVLPDKMTVHLNVLGVLIKDQVVSNPNHTLVVIVEWRESEKLYTYIC